MYLSVIKYTEPQVKKIFVKEKVIISFTWKQCICLWNSFPVFKLKKKKKEGVVQWLKRPKIIIVVSDICNF